MPRKKKNDEGTPEVNGTNRIDELLHAGAVPLGKPEAPKEQAPKEQAVKLVIPPLNVKIIAIKVRGISPLIIRAWDSKTKAQLAGKQAGERRVKSRESVDPNDVYNAARYVATEGWDGMKAGAFKAAMVDAVRCGDIPKTEFNMTVAKTTFFVLADGIDSQCGCELVRIYGSPERYDMMQPTTGGGPYMSYRPIYRNWGAVINIGYNAARIDAQGIMNLISAAGYYVGVGEHRPSSKNSKTGSSGRWEILPETYDMESFLANKRGKRGSGGRS